MDIHFDDDELSRLLNDPRRDNRRDIWMWIWLYRYEDEGKDLDPATCNGATMRSAIAHCLTPENDLLERINRQQERSMVSSDQLRWIDGSKRQYQWLISRIEDLTNIRPPPGPRELVHLVDRDHLIAMLDIWDVDIAKKADQIEYLHETWLEHKASDSKFAWFEDKKTGSQRCQCAWEWLKKNHSPISRRQLPISNHQELLMFFDKENLAPYMQKTILQQIKRKWTRKQFDERTADKKQVNVMLSKAVIAQLDELAKQHDLKRAQIVERLVAAESATRTYLPGSLKSGK